MIIREREKERKRGRERKKLTKNIIMIRERETETERGKSCLIGRWCRKWSRVVVLGRGEWFRILSHFQGFQRLSHSDESFAFAVDVAGFLHQDLAFLGQQGSFHVSQRTDDPALEVVDPSSEAGPVFFEVEDGSVALGSRDSITDGGGTVTAVTGSGSRSWSGGRCWGWCGRSSVTRNWRSSVAGSEASSDDSSMDVG